MTLHGSNSNEASDHNGDTFEIRTPVRGMTGLDGIMNFDNYQEYDAIPSRDETSHDLDVVVCFHMLDRKQGNAESQCNTLKKNNTTEDRMALDSQVLSLT